ncbi:hypothetical protein [Streptomyces sp. NPDC056337]|uniref:hypothetical protein n=1 Tax=Streptomyces sp. NPDC056337 TaxID=3345787 RepID=UPI0035E20FB3
MTPIIWLAASKEGGTDWKITLAAASLPALASIIAAVIAARSARVAKKSEIEAQRVRELEERISEKKYDTYKPMIDLFKDALDRQAVDENTHRERISAFATWVAIFGSDEAIKAFHNFMQATYHSAPAPILMRLYADFVLAARRDMGYPDTVVTRKEILGSRITDAHTHPLFVEIDKPFMELCRDMHWTPPWPSAARHGG